MLSETGDEAAPTHHWLLETRAWSIWMVRRLLPILIAVEIGILGAELVRLAQHDPRAAAVVVVVVVLLAMGWSRWSGHPRRQAVQPDSPAATAADLAAEFGEDVIVRGVLRSLAHGLRAPIAAVPLAVHVGDDRVELFWDRPPPRARPPWGDARSGWVWDAPVGAMVPTGDPEPDAGLLPALVAAGATGFGDLYLNLEALDVLSLVGDRSDTARYAQHLISMGAAADLDVWITGTGALEHETNERVRRVELDATVIETRRRRAALRRDFEGRDWTSTFAARLAGPSRAASLVPLLLVVLDPDGDDAAFEGLMRAARGHSGVVIVVVDRAVADAVEFACAAGGVSVPFLGNVAVVLPDPESLDDEHESTTLSATLPELPESAWSGPEITLSPEADAAPPPQHTMPPPRPPLVEVRVLGPVVIEGTRSPLAGKSVELVAYLACHPDGVAVDRIKAALWPERVPRPSTWLNRVSACRHALGVGTDGQPLFPRFEGGIGRLAPGVRTDVDRLEDALACVSSQDSDQARATLRDALEVVRGRPFDESAGYDWAFRELEVARAERAVTDVAHRLADSALTAGEWRLAAWATECGLRACPTSEQLAQDRMRAFYAAGDLSGVDAVMRDLLAALEVDDPQGAVHPETLALHQRLSHRAPNA